MVTAVVCLILNLLFAFYNGILGLLSSSLLFSLSAVYYVLLSVMRFTAVVLNRKSTAAKERLTASLVGILLILLSGLFPAIIFLSIRDNTAALYGTIPMITIATFTFGKITAAVLTAVKHRHSPSRLFRTVNAIRYSEVAVSLLTMQQSMLVSFGEEGDGSAVILNACTGAGVCLFLLFLGILTFHSRKGVSAWPHQK